ncbi:hypothetical protein [Orlajensenia leifsoniae]|uniref:Hemagglutinin n=1 Tax=Orlajensenia leifsoniae TaxID=2561933 RepID=A0A4Y9QV15_9MICO|nr:hypothetical protein [Leifsonia flava]TFV96359.1 hypothetical protein E4M00_13605 [Leifsonia flava]
MTSPTRPLLRRICAAVAAVVLAGVVIAGSPAPDARAGGFTAAGAVSGLGASTLAAVQSHPFYAAAVGAEQTDGDDFDPGLIISDYNFFNSAAMTEEQVQDFLDSAPCKPRDESPCLRDFSQDTTFQAAVERGHCDAYLPGKDESAARIITKVAAACGVSPRVLLVLLQKEQSLVTRPNASGYLRATGYGCPDTADCDQKYFGFFNQVYNAAWQFRQYTQHPDRAYRIGAVPVGFNPDAACGSTVVKVANQATANLYNYTPYQPNKAALADLKGEGDDCSTHGNLNFWLLYSKWFGSPDTEPYPTIFGPCANLVGGQPCDAPRWVLDDVEDQRLLG